jgi:hypothetical protein
MHGAVCELGGRPVLRARVQRHNADLESGGGVVSRGERGLGREQTTGWTRAPAFRSPPTL